MDCLGGAGAGWRRTFAKLELGFFHGCIAADSLASAELASGGNHKQKFGGIDHCEGFVRPLACGRRSRLYPYKFFWLLSPELRWLGQPGNGNLTVCGVMVDVLGEQLVSGSV